MVAEGEVEAMVVGVVVATGMEEVEGMVVEEVKVMEQEEVGEAQGMEVGELILEPVVSVSKWRSSVRGIKFKRP